MTGLIHYLELCRVASVIRGCREGTVEEIMISTEKYVYIVVDSHW